MAPIKQTMLPSTSQLSRQDQSAQSIEPGHTQTGEDNGGPVAS